MSFVVTTNPMPASTKTQRTESCMVLSRASLTLGSAKTLRGWTTDVAECIDLYGKSKAASVVNSLCGRANHALYVVGVTTSACDLLCGVVIRPRTLHFDYVGGCVQSPCGGVSK